MTIPWFALRFQRREETDALKLAIREAEDRPDHPVREARFVHPRQGTAREALTPGAEPLSSSRNELPL